jgi:Protein of unknown function (DUF1015)
MGARIPRVLLPKSGIDLDKWAVIACDQFTSEPEYWQQVSSLVGDAPSTYHLILPEAYLGTPGEAERVDSIRRSMQDYLQRDLFTEQNGLVLVEREVAGKTRYGIMLALDLEDYDYRPGSTSLIRATEGTILERIPPRVRIRSGAPLEVPHILVLIDDPERTVIEPLVAARTKHPVLYDFELMLGSGRLTGYSVRENAAARALAALEKLADPPAFARKYGLEPGAPVLLFAMGDGNHSLATAKAIWEQIKPQAGMDHPARYALVEVENLHDDGLGFEPILRVVFDVKEDLYRAMDAFYPDRCRSVPCANAGEMAALVDRHVGQEHQNSAGTSHLNSVGTSHRNSTGTSHAIGVVTPQGCSVVFISHPPSNLPVGTLQSFLDAWGKRGGFSRIDYVHGADVAARLGSQPGNLGFYLPAISKSDFFKTVILDGALPRKTFSMGEARAKRFYMEARRIT